MHIHASIIARNHDCQQLCAQALVLTRNSITQQLNARRPQHPGVRFAYSANTLTINEGIPSHNSNLGTPWWPEAGRGGNRSRLRSTGTETITKIPRLIECLVHTVLIGHSPVQAKTRCRKTEMGHAAANTASARVPGDACPHPPSEWWFLKVQHLPG